MEGQQEDSDMMDAPSFGETQDEPAIPDPVDQDAPSSATAPATAAPITPAPIVSNNDPNFKYKYAEAGPTPDGEDDVIWNKIFTAADSRMYNKHGKDANNSKKFRISGETRRLALTMLAERKAKEAAGIPPRAPPKPRTTIKKTATSSAKRPAPGEAHEESGSLDLSMSISEKIKAEGRARKSSSSVAPASNRGTPAPSGAISTGSPAPTMPKVEKPRKKGTASIIKKTKPKPMSKPASQTPGDMGSTRASETPGPTFGDSPSSGYESSGDGRLYCICRRPDDHSLMIQCVQCDDWYHPKCMKILEADARNGLVDVFICTKCTNHERYTTYRRMCRNHNVDGKCRMPARVTDDPPSKYCSEKCARIFWKFIVTIVRSDQRPTLGGALSQEECAALLAACPTTTEIHALGMKPRLLLEGADPARPVGLDYTTDEEKASIGALTLKMRSIESQIDGFQKQSQLLNMTHERAKLAQKQLVKKICGYDPRLSYNDEQFKSWSQTSEGKTAFETGVLGPPTAETKNINNVILAPTFSTSTAIPSSDFSSLAGGGPVPAVKDTFSDICNASGKKDKHYGWREIHNQEFTESQSVLRKELRKLEEKIQGIVDDAETREATKDYDAGNYAVWMGYGSPPAGFVGHLWNAKSGL